MRINGQFRFLSCIAEHEYCDLLERGDDLNGKKAPTATAPLICHSKIYFSYLRECDKVVASCFLAPHTVQTLNSSCSVCFIHLKWTCNLGVSFFVVSLALVQVNLDLSAAEVDKFNQIKCKSDNIC